MPLHSIIMPVYNGERYLAAAIQSILDQTCADLELIVVDDGSLDDSLHIVRQFAQQDARVRSAATAINSGGPAIPKNLGLSLARGSFISFCDQDDLLLPHKLERASDVFARHPELDIIFFDFLPFGAQHKAQQAYLDGRNFIHCASDYLAPLSEDVFLCKNFWGCMAGISTGMSTQTIVCRRQIVADKKFDTRFRIIDDITMWYSIAESARIAFVNQAAALYRHHDHALTNDSALLTLETVAFHRENYFRQRHLFNAAENRRYRRMLSRFFVRCASLPKTSKLEERSYLLQSLVFDFRLNTFKWLLQTLA